MASPYGDTRIILAGMAPGWPYWDWHLWDTSGTALARTDLTGTALRRPRWDSGTGTAMRWPLWDGGTRTALGWSHWNDGTSTALAWPHYKGTGTGLAGMASPEWHQGGLTGTCHLSLFPHNYPIPGWGHPRPLLLPHQFSWAWETQGTGLLAAGLETSVMFGHCCSGGGCGRRGLCSAAGSIPTPAWAPAPSQPCELPSPFEEEEEMHQNPGVSTVVWPGWEGEKAGGKKGCAQLL